MDHVLICWVQVHRKALKMYLFENRGFGLEPIMENFVAFFVGSTNIERSQKDTEGTLFGFALAEPGSSDVVLHTDVHIRNLDLDVVKNFELEGVQVGLLSLGRLLDDSLLNHGLKLLFEVFGGVDVSKLPACGLLGREEQVDAFEGDLNG